MQPPRYCESHFEALDYPEIDKDANPERYMCVHWDKGTKLSRSIRITAVMVLQ